MIRFFTVVLLVTVFAASCQQSQNSSQQYHSPKAFTKSLPKVKPEQITVFSSVDTLFFGYLAVDSVPLDDGSFVLADPQSGFVIHVDSSGNLIKKVANKGRGPGELLDGLFLQRRSGGGFCIYDQFNEKTVFFGSNLKYEKEVVMRASTLGNFSKVYELRKDGYLLTEGDIFDMSLNSDSERKTNIAVINRKGNEVLHEVQLKARPYVILGKGGSATALPFAHRQLIRYRPKTQTFNTYWTGSDTLAEVNAQFDTLNTIAIDLPVQKVSGTEIDSLEREYSKEEWQSVEEKLPEQKTSVENMRIDERGRFWLKLSYRSNFDQWLILDSEGKPQKIVQLPKGTMLTHVSRHHLGVRMGPGTFALYAPVN